MSDLNEGIAIDTLFKNALRQWPVLFILGLAGALFGLLFGRIYPPVYEAEAVLGISIQYAVVKERELVLEDRILHRVAQLIMSDATFEEVFERVPPEMRVKNKWAVADDVRQSIHLERRLTDWKLVASNPSPEIAQQIAALWVDVAMDALTEAQDHAWQAVALMGEQQFQLVCDPAPSVPESDSPADWDCTVEPISLDPEALSGLLRTEIALSHGILPAITIEKVRDPLLPGEPVLRNSNILILAGAFIGLAFGFWIVGVLGVRFPRIWRRMEQASG